MSKRTGGIVRSNGDTRASGGSRIHCGKRLSQDDISARKEIHRRTLERNKRKRISVEKNVRWEKCEMAIQIQIDKSRKRKKRLSLA